MAAANTFNSETIRDVGRTACAARGVFADELRGQDIDDDQSDLSRVVTLSIASQLRVFRLRSERNRDLFELVNQIQLGSPVKKFYGVIPDLNQRTQSIHVVGARIHGNVLRFIGRFPPAGSLLRRKKAESRPFCTRIH